MRPSGRVRPALTIALVLVLQGSTSLAQSQTDPTLDTLRCAAGFGCMTQCEMLEALGLASSEDAKSRYASEHPADYVRDVEALGGKAPESCEVDRPLAAGGSSGSGAQAAGGGVKPARTDKPAQTVQSGEDYTNWEGYSEASCPGTRLDDPRFVIQRSLNVLACFKGEDGSFSECGINPARAVCLMNGYLDVACYGVKRAKAAANLDAVCESGSCLAFSYVVCR